MSGIIYVLDDGGREAAGYRGKADDCVVRAIAIAAEQPYQEVYDTVIRFALYEREMIGRKRSHARTGVRKVTTRRVMDHYGWKWTPLMGIGTGCKVHLLTDELPFGRIIVKLSKHVAAVINGVLYDTYDSSRGGTRCVYGYWSKP